MSYISKDFIHRGIGLLLDPEKAWRAVHPSVRKNVNKARRAGVRVERVAGTPAELALLRDMWYDPADPNLPTALGPEDPMFMAWGPAGEPLGACVLLRVGNHLFLNNLTANPAGKQLGTPDLLLWHCVEALAGTDLRYIDVGVSYRPTLYRFFKKWRTVDYPVIFHPPRLAPRVSRFPFHNGRYGHAASQEAAQHAMARLEAMLGGAPFTFVPDVAQGARVLEELGHAPRDATFRFPDVGDGPCLVDLPLLFGVQFGCLIVHLALPDAELWSRHGCLDAFKRELTLSTLSDELADWDGVLARRAENVRTLGELFELDGIAATPPPPGERVPRAFGFEHPLNDRYRDRLSEFDVDHDYDPIRGWVGLPVHQGLGRPELEYVYGIFRGVLNLCSEWVHTETRAAYKPT